MSTSRNGGDDPRIDMLVETASETKATLAELIKGINLLTQFQVRIETRREAELEWRKSVEYHQLKQDSIIERNQISFDEWKKDEFEPVRKAQMKNTLLVNGLYVAAGGIIGSVATWAFKQIGG